MAYQPRLVLGDGPQLSAFGKLKTIQSRTIFDCQNEYGLDTLRLWDATANGTLVTASTDASVSSGGNSVGPTNTNHRMTPITVSATNGHYSILQSRQYLRYIPGKGHVTYITGIFAAGSGASVSICLRSSCTGSIVDTEVAQADWNFDKMDGTGPSGKTLDFTKVQFLIIDSQMLFTGRVRVGFDIDGLIYWAHYFLIANHQALPTVQTYNLPVRMEGRTTASTTDFRIGYFDTVNGVFLKTSRTSLGGTINFTCCSVQVEGEEELRGFSLSAPSGISTIAVTTRRPIISIRPKATYNSRTNRAHIEQVEYLIRASTNDSLVELVYGGTLTGASFTSVGSESVAEYDTSATAISGGTVGFKGFALSGAGVVASAIGGKADPRQPLCLSKIDALTATQSIVSVVCTSFTGTSNVTPIMNWFEQVV